MFNIGRIIKPHGIKGDVKVFPVTDEPARFERLKTAEINFDGRRGALSLGVERVWHHKGLVMLKLKGIDSMNDAEPLRGGWISVPDSEALPLGEGEYYMRDLLGMNVKTSEGEELGVISDILETGANDVYVVQKEGAADVLIPAVKQYILSVDVKARLMVVELAEGLRG